MFGAAAVPHRHAFSVEVTVQGEVDPETGFMVDLEALDRAIGSAVEPCRRGDLNEAFPEAREGGEIPSTENLARWIWNRLESAVPGGCRLEGVRVAESGTLAAEYSRSGS